MLTQRKLRSNFRFVAQLFVKLFFTKSIQKEKNSKNYALI